MKMHFLHRSVVGMTLRLSNHLVHFHDIFTDCFRNDQVRYNSLDITEVSVHMVVMVAVLVIMVVVAAVIMVFIVAMMMVVGVIMVFIVVMMVVAVIMVFIVAMIMVVGVIMIFIVVVMVVVAVIMIFIVAMIMVVAVIMIFIVVMMMVVPVYVQALFLLAVYSHLKMGTPNAAFFHGFRGINNSRNSKHIQFLQHFFRLRVKFQKGSRKHITCRTHIAFEI